VPHSCALRVFMQASVLCHNIFMCARVRVCVCVCVRRKGCASVCWRALAITLKKSKTHAHTRTRTHMHTHTHMTTTLAHHPPQSPKAPKPRRGVRPGAHEAESGD